MYGHVCTGGSAAGTALTCIPHPAQNFQPLSNLWLHCGQ
jgi:hypothetical protein